MASKKKSKSKSAQSTPFSSDRGDHDHVQYRTDDPLPRDEEEHSQYHPSRDYMYAGHDGTAYELNVPAEYSLYHPMNANPPQGGRVKSREKKTHYDSGIGSHGHFQHGIGGESDQPISLVIHQRTYEGEPQPSTSSSAHPPTEKKREQTCRFCYNHGKMFPKKNHKYQCQHIDCECERCKVTRDNQKSMREHQRQTRHQKTEFVTAPLAVAALPRASEDPQIWEFPESRRKEFEPILTEDCSDLIGQVEELCKRAKKQ